MCHNKKIQFYQQLWIHKRYAMILMKQSVITFVHFLWTAGYLIEETRIVCLFIMFTGLVFLYINSLRKLSPVVKVALIKQSIIIYPSGRNTKSGYFKHVFCITALWDNYVPLYRYVHSNNIEHVNVNTFDDLKSLQRL